MIPKNFRQYMEDAIFLVIGIMMGMAMAKLFVSSFIVR